MQLVATSTPSAVAPKPTGTAHDRLSRTISAANVGVLTQIVTNMDSIPDAAHVTPAALVAGIDVAAYASTVSDALRSAHAVAPWSKPLLPAAEQAVQG
ncbi:MAG: hypothetical protein H7276_18725, partial [Caulobacter sp.]|nr:hypothetical protein [Vitreoscilla sp.]